MEKTRCAWPLGNEKMVLYHDTEWGAPLHDDCKLFEFMVLDAFQAGLSWSTVLNKRENFRKAFNRYDIQKIAGYGKREKERLLGDAGIIRNKMKIDAAIHNAASFIKVQEQYGSFDSYIWRFTKGKTIHNKWKSPGDIPCSTPLSDTMSRDLIKHDFKFVGSTICYAFIQAIGMVNDHIVSCFRHKELKGKLTDRYSLTHY